MGKCPLLKKECIREQCEWYTHLLGKNPNNGQPINEGGCAIKWLPILLVEARQATAGVQKATESFRNDVLKANYNQPLPAPEEKNITYLQERTYD